MARHQDHGADLADATARWRRTRHPRLADLCEQIVARQLAEVPRPALVASKRAADLAAWTAVARALDPFDIPRLAAAARGGTQAQVIEHVAALAHRDDPGCAGALLALLEEPPYAGIKSRPLLAAILDALAGTRDLRASEPARALGRRYLTIVNSSTGGWVSGKLATIADQLAATAPAPLAGDDLARCEELEARFGKREVTAPPEGAKTLAELLAEVYAAPHDDGPRQVYADALLELGEPRGEWIVLDLARARGALDAAGLARQRALANDAQLAAWAHPLSNGGEVRFERGFPAAIRLYREGKILIGVPELATLHTLTGLAQVSQKAALALLDSPSARHLREVGTLSETLLATACKHPRAWTAIEVMVERTLPTRATFAQLPALRELELSLPRALELPAETLDLPGLRTLTLRHFGTCAALALPASLEILDAKFAALPALALDQLPALHELRLQYEGTATHLPVPATLAKLALTAAELPRITGATALAQLDLHVRSLAPTQLAALATARDVRLHLATSAPRDLFAGFALEALDLIAPGYDDDVLAGQHALRRLRMHNLSPEHVPEAPLVELALALPAGGATLPPLIARTPTLRELQLTTGLELDPGQLAWLAPLPDQLERFELSFPPRVWGSARHLRLVRDPETRRWHCPHRGRYDEVALAVFAAFGAEPPTNG